MNKKAGASIFFFCVQLILIGIPFHPFPPDGIFTPSNERTDKRYSPVLHEKPGAANGRFGVQNELIVVVGVAGEPRGRQHRVGGRCGRRRLDGGRVQNEGADDTGSAKLKTIMCTSVRRAHS